MPRPTPDRTTDSHNHVEVVAALKWRVDLRHAARGAHSVRIGPATASNLCSRVADRAPHKTTLAFPAPPICAHLVYPIRSSAVQAIGVSGAGRCDNVGVRRRKLALARTPLTGGRIPVRGFENEKPQPSGRGFFTSASCLVRRYLAIRLHAPGLGGNPYAGRATVVGWLVVPGLPLGQQRKHAPVRHPDTVVFGAEYPIVATGTGADSCSRKQRPPRRRARRAQSPAISTSCKSATARSTSLTTNPMRPPGSRSPSSLSMRSPSRT